MRPYDRFSIRERDSGDPLVTLTAVACSSKIAADCRFGQSKTVADHVRCSFVRNKHPTVDGSYVGNSRCRAFGELPRAIWRISVTNIQHSSVYLRSHLSLLLRVTKSEISSRFAGSILGIGWWALTPLLLLAIYAATYLLILKVQVPSLSGPEYVVLIFTGLVPFLMSSEALLSGVSSVVANKSVLANTVFPVDLVPIKTVLLSQITMVCGMVIVLIAATVLGRLSFVILLFPVAWALHVMFLIGIIWILSLVNLVFRDLQNIIGVVVMYLMIASPIAYTPEMVPKGMELLLVLNPLAHFIVAYQDLIVFGRLPSLSLTLTITVMSLATFVIGGLFFARAKRTLVDYV